MPAYSRRASGIPIGFGTIVVLLLMLWSIGCTQAAPTASASASSTPHPLGTAPLSTFPFNRVTSATSEQPKVTATLEPKTQLRVGTDWALGPSERQTSRLKDIAYGRYEPGDIVIEWWLYNYPSTDLLRRGARVDACTILMGVVHGPLDYTAAVLHGYARSEQVQWNSDEGLLVVSLTYHKATAQNIDFDNHYYLCPDKIYDLADRSIIAPEYR